MKNGFPSTRTIAIAVALILAACSSKRREIETTNPGPGKSPGVEAGDDGDPQWRPGIDEGTASVVTEIPQAELMKYLDPNAKLEYKFSYLSANKSGTITFADSKARIEINDLPINQSGTMKLEMFENGVVKLEGSKEAVVLKAGQNSLSMGLKQVGGGVVDGNDKADLVLNLEIIPEGTTDNGGIDGTTVGNKFQDVILPMAKSYCTDCHAKFSLAAPDSEAYYKARGQSLISRLSKTASNTMPQRSSQEAQRMSDDDRIKMIDYIKGL